MAQCGWLQANAARLLRMARRQPGRAMIKNRIAVHMFRCDWTGAGSG
jgi:hypothetical protein